MEEAEGGRLGEGGERGVGFVRVRAAVGLGEEGGQPGWGDGRAVESGREGGVEGLLEMGGGGVGH